MNKREKLPFFSVKVDTTALSGGRNSLALRENRDLLLDYSRKRGDPRAKERLVGSLKVGTRVLL